MRRSGGSFMSIVDFLASYWFLLVLAALFAVLVVPSIKIIDPTEVGLVTTAARKKQADGEATYIAETGRAKGAEVEAVGLARAKGFEAQVRALGQGPTAVINVTTALAERGIKIMPEILALGGGGTLEGVGATLMKFLANQVGAEATPTAAEAPKSEGCPSNNLSSNYACSMRGGEREPSPASGFVMVSAASRRKSALFAAASKGNRRLMTFPPQNALAGRQIVHPSILASWNSKPCAERI
jgi:hypothetical protein